eukprot:285845-Alexandrium_andersonii.AAC.1
MSLKSLQCWWVLKAKAYNCAMVSLWLHDRATRLRDRSEAYAVLDLALWGFCSLWDTFVNAKP